MRFFYQENVESLPSEQKMTEDFTKLHIFCLLLIGTPKSIVAPKVHALCNQSQYGPRRI